MCTKRLPFGAVTTVGIQFVRYQQGRPKIMSQ